MKNRLLLVPAIGILSGIFAVHIFAIEEGGKESGKTPKEATGQPAKKPGFFDRWFGKPEWQKTAQPLEKGAVIEFEPLRNGQVETIGPNNPKGFATPEEIAEHEKVQQSLKMIAQIKIPESIALKPTFEDIGMEQKPNREKALQAFNDLIASKTTFSSDEIVDLLTRADTMSSAAFEQQARGNEHQQWQSVVNKLERRFPGHTAYLELVEPSPKMGSPTGVGENSLSSIESSLKKLANALSGPDALDTNKYTKLQELLKKFETGLTSYTPSRLSPEEDATREELLRQQVQALEKQLNVKLKSVQKSVTSTPQVMPPFQSTRPSAQQLLKEIEKIRYTKSGNVRFSDIGMGNATQRNAALTAFQEIIASDKTFDSQDIIGMFSKAEVMATAAHNENPFIATNEESRAWRQIKEELSARFPVHETYLLFENEFNGKFYKSLLDTKEDLAEFQIKRTNKLFEMLNNIVTSKNLLDKALYGQLKEQITQLTDQLSEYQDTSQKETILLLQQRAKKLDEELDNKIHAVEN
ncbi:MAG: hypothetical protein WCE21_00410 [Candidatus Babeliales bacterium]